MRKGKSKTRVEWSTGDIFLIPLRDGSAAVGQALDLMMENIARIVLTDVRVSRSDVDGTTIALNPSNVIAALATWRDPIDDGRWRIAGARPLLLAKDRWPNEQTRS